MKPLPRSDQAIVLRTDFSDDAAWEEIRAEIGRPVDGFYAYVTFVDDRAYDGLRESDVPALFTGESPGMFVIVADRRAMAEPDHPLLIMDLMDEPGRSFRAVPSQVQSIENNLSIANMDYEEFADAVGEDGVFRGFPPTW